MLDLRDPQPTTHTRHKKATTYAELAMIHVGLDAHTTRDGAMTHREDEENMGIRLGQVACGGASDRGSGHGGLVMVFISTMGFGFEDEEHPFQITLLC